MTDISADSAGRGNTRPPRPATDGPTLHGDKDLLSGAALSLSMDTLMARYAPAQLSIQGLSFEDAANIVSEALLPHEEWELTPEQLRRFVELTAHHDSLENDDLAGLRAKEGDLLLRQILTLTGAERSLTEKAGLEFSIHHPFSRGCAVTVSPGKVPGVCDVTLDFDGWLEFQSEYSLAERWEFLSTILIAAGDIDTAACKTRSLDSERRRFQLEERATIEVVERDLLSAHPSLDAHLSQRADLIALCALVPSISRSDVADIDESEDELLPRDEAAEIILPERLAHLHTELSKICSAMPDSINLRNAALTRDQLGHLGDRLFLPNTDHDISLITIDDFILVVTKASTGRTLLEDLTALERYRSRIETLSESPAPHALKSIESTAVSDDKILQLLGALDLPTREYFAAAMRSFVDDDGREHIEGIKDGLLDAVLSGKPATVTLTREFFIEGLEEDEEEEAVEDAETGEDTEWLTDPAAVRIFRTASAVPTDGGSYTHSPAVSFIPAYASGLDPAIEEEFAADGSILSLSVPSNRAGVSNLPVELAETALRALGQNPEALDVIVALADFTSGDREAYLSKSVRVQF